MMTDNMETPIPIVSNQDTKPTEEEDFKSKYLYLLAEFDNYKKNVHNRVLTLEQNNLKDLVNKFLPIIDDLERFAEVMSDKESKSIVNMILKKFHDTLLTYGIKKYVSLGEKFTHDLHNVIVMEDADPSIESGTIIKVYQEGYKYNNKILRFASVGVAK